MSEISETELAVKLIVSSTLRLADAESALNKNKSGQIDKM